MNNGDNSPFFTAQLALFSIICYIIFIRLLFAVFYLRH